MSTVLLESLHGWWPELILSAGALLVILVGVWTRRAQPPVTVAWVALAASAAALWYAPVPTATGLFSGLIVCDPFSAAFRWLALGVGTITLLLIMGSRDVDRALHGEYVGLLLFVVLGLMLMAEANHLLMAYVAMELVSLSSYALVGLADDARSAEASLKYLLFGALSSGLMLFGMSLLFGLTGALAFPELLKAIAGLGGAPLGALLLATTLLLVGLAFKISMVPFHMWTPDAYEGAPLPVTALLSVGPKAAGLALLLRLTAILHYTWPRLGPLLAGLTIVTMTLGNLAALTQTNIKRLLAYSTIGQVGYLLIGCVAHTPDGAGAIILYLVAYVFMNLGAFACVVAVVHDAGSESLEAFRGLARRAPALALLLALFLLSLAGIPPLLGFFGKFLLFGAAIGAGQRAVALVAIVNSAIALYYYVNVIRLMYLLEPRQRTPVATTGALRLALGVCAAATLLLGLFPAGLLQTVTSRLVMNLL